MSALSTPYANLTTEAVNEATKQIDQCSTLDIVTSINAQDAMVAGAVQLVLPQIADAVDRIYQRLAGGGRLFYIGAGTSGRLGVLDASECPPTYGTSPQLVQAFIAGGDVALRTAVEGCEDNGKAGQQLVEEAGMNEQDVLVGITASGSAAFVIEAVRSAKQKGCATVAVINNKGSQLESLVDVAIVPVVGPEVVVGSTRMKAGTSQKMVLNMLTTATMIKLGKVYGNLMVDVNASNIKLLDRARRIVAQAAGVDENTAQQTLVQADMSAKLAIAMLKTGLDKERAAGLLQQTDGRLADAIALARP